MSVRSSVWVRAIGHTVLLAVSGLAAGCSTTSIYKKTATVGLELVGDCIAEDAAYKEYEQLLGRSAADVDQRFGSPRNVFREVSTGREIRTYDVAGDVLGNGRWVVELANGRVDALSRAQLNPDVGKDQAKALLLQERLRGLTPEQVRATPVAGRFIFDAAPRTLKRVPGGELVQVYNVTSFLDLTGARFIVVDYDAAGRCHEVRYVGTP